MCTNIKPLLGRYRYPLYVRCGHCPACLQEKAFKSAAKIRDNYPFDGHPMRLFVTLTYDNRHVPFIDGNDLDSLPVYKRSFIDKQEPDDGQLYKRIPIYRNCKTDFLDDGKKRVFRKKHVIDYVNVPLHHFTDVVPDVYRSNFLRGQYFLTPSSETYKRLRSSGHDIKSPHFSVCYYRDFVLFMKRLRINLQRKYNVSIPIKYFCCTEYGPTTNRAHLHLLMDVPDRPLKEWQSSIAKAWPYARFSQTKQQVQIAINAASYVASYVNCSTTIPTLLAKSFPPEHHHSKGYGFGRKEFSFKSVFAAFLAGDLRYYCERVTNHTTTHVRVLLPQYVLRRYVPKIKGFGCLTSDEIKSIYSGLQPVRKFYNVCQLTETDIHRIDVLLRHKRALAASYGVSALDYGIFASRLWTIYNSNLMIDFYNNQLNPFESYDNISYFFDGVVSSPTLENLPTTQTYFERDPNKFQHNLFSTQKMETYFHEYTKKRKLTSLTTSLNI